MTASGVGFLISSLGVIGVLVWWVRLGRAVVERRVLLDVRRAMESSRGWRSLSIFANGGYAQAGEQRQLTAQLWRLGVVTLVLMAGLMLIAAGMTFMP